MEGKVQEAIELLNHSKSKKRESGAKRLRKFESKIAGASLLKVLEKEIEDSRTWSTQYHLILALGHAGYDKALPFLLDLAKREFDATILYSGLGDSIFRLSILKTTIEDSLELIYSFSNFKLTYGAFQALAMKRLVPNENVIKKIIEKGNDPKGAEEVKEHPNDQTGLRKWIAAASAGWENELKSEFLNGCEKIKGQHLAMAVESSRKGKYINWGSY